MIGDRSLVADIDELVKKEVKVNTNEIVLVLSKGVVNKLTK